MTFTSGTKEKVCYRQPLLQDPIPLDEETHKNMWKIVDELSKYEFKAVSSIYIDYVSIQDIYLGALLRSLPPHVYDQLKLEIPAYSKRYVEISHIDITLYFQETLEKYTHIEPIKNAITNNLIAKPEYVLLSSPFTSWIKILNSIDKQVIAHNHKLLEKTSPNTAIINTYPLPASDTVTTIIQKFLQPTLLHVTNWQFFSVPFNKFSPSMYFDTKRKTPLYDLYIFQTPYIFNTNEEVIDLIFRHLAFKQTYIILPKMVFPLNVDEFFNLKIKKIPNLNAIFDLTQDILRLTMYVDGVHLLPKTLIIK